MTITALYRRQSSRPATGGRRAMRLSKPTMRLSKPTMRLHNRNLYPDFLLSLALIGVMTYHVFGWAWLPFLFPSMGVMFALAGSLVAGSLERSPGNPWRVLKKGTTRLLPPVWLFGLIAIPVMLVAGWTHSETAGAELNWQTLLFWILPISDPPASTFGADWVTPLWYIRACLWFLLLSPATLWLFRHWPKRMLALPVSVVVLSAVGLLPLEGRSGDVILTIAMFGGCWMLGFAHHDNRIRPQPLAKALLGGISLMALGLLWTFTHPDPVSAYDIANIPMANTLYSLGAVRILLRLHPDLSWMDKCAILDKIATVIASRAVTIYLWVNVAIFLSNSILSRWSVIAHLDPRSAHTHLLRYLASWLILIGLVFLFGWCEDLAAGRDLRVNPWPRGKTLVARHRKARTFPHPTFENSPWMADLTPRRLFMGTSFLLAAASALSIALLAGTDTPGRSNTADAPSRNAVNSRPDAKPPDNLGQGNGQKFVLDEGLANVRNAVRDVGKSIRTAITKVNPPTPSTVPPPNSRGVPLDLTQGTKKAKPLSSAGLLAVPAPEPTVPADAPTPRPPGPTPKPTVPAPVPTPRPPGPTPKPTVPAPVPTPRPPGPTPKPTVPAPVPTPQPSGPKPTPTVPAPVPTVPTVPTSAPTVPAPVPTVLTAPTSAPTVPAPVPAPVATVLTAPTSAPTVPTVPAPRSTTPTPLP